MSFHSLLSCRVSAERSAVNLMGIPLYVICCFSLAAFNIFCLYLIFDSLINMCLGVFLFGFILYGTLCASWTWLTISFPMLGKFLIIISSNIFSDPFFSSSSSGTPIIQMLVCLMLSQRSLRLSSILFLLFSLFYSPPVISTILSSSSLIHCFASVTLLLIPSRIFYISVIVLFITVCLLFSSSRSLLNISCIFSILFLTFWIIFTIVTPNSFSGRLSILSSFIWSCMFLPFSFVCNIFFWPEASSTGVCRQLCSARSWCLDEDLWEASLQLIFPGVWGSLLVQRFGLGAPTTGARADLRPGNQNSAGYMVWPKKKQNKTKQYNNKE